MKSAAGPDDPARLPSRTAIRDDGIIHINTITAEHGHSGIRKIEGKAVLALVPLHDELLCREVARRPRVGRQRRSSLPPPVRISLSPSIFRAR